MGIETMYESACGSRTDINEHLPTLRLLSSMCRQVVELGTGRMNSTVAIAAGGPELLVTVDSVERTAVSVLQSAHDCKTKIVHVVQDSREPVPVTGYVDMVFIDSKHTREHVLAELESYSEMCSRWFVLHDSIAYGEHGEDGCLGIMHGVREFIAKNSKWFIKAEWRNNNGLLLLEKAQ